MTNRPTNSRLSLYNISYKNDIDRNGYATTLRPDIVAMEPYTPIVPFEVLSARLGRPVEEIIKLDANENPYGPSPKALAALAEGKFFHIYPDPESNQLREALVDVTGVPKEYLLAGAGADELIDIVARAIINPGDGIINCPPSFGMYPFTAHVNSAHLISVPRRADFSLDVEGIIAAASHSPTPKLIYLCSPNNPDGSTISDTDLRRILALPLLVVLDEAYVEFQVSSSEFRVSSFESRFQVPGFKLQNSSLPISQSLSLSVSQSPNLSPPPAASPGCAITITWWYSARLASWQGWRGCAWGMGRFRCG